MYKRKTIDTWELQGNYGHGWEYLCGEDNRADIIMRWREYKENDFTPGARFRVKCRRESR